MTDQSDGAFGSTGAGEALLALAERCEKATQYDGRLMAEIDCAVRFPHLRPAEPGDHPSVKDRAFNPSDIWTNTGWLMARNYYRSVDDALLLVPNGRDWMVDNFDGPHDRRCSTSVFKAESDEYADYEAFCATPALALCAAALRARAAIALATGAAALRARAAIALATGAAA